MSLVTQVPLPQRAHELAQLGRIDYADCFVVPTATTRSPEEWVRLAAAAQPALFSFVRVAHRGLGLHLAPGGSAAHVIGWDVLRSAEDEVVLGNSGALGTARIVGLTPPGAIVLATVIMFDGLRGKALWRAAGPVHRRVARHVLGQLPSREAGSDLRTPVIRDS